MSPLLVALAAGGAVLLARPVRPRLRGAAAGTRWTGETGRAGPARSAGRARVRLPAAVLAGLAGPTVVGGAVGVLVGVVAAVVTWSVLGADDAALARRDDARVRADLPALVTLLGAALRSGAPTATAVAGVARALPGAAADRLLAATARLELGVDPVAAWSDLARDPGLGPLGRTLARTQATGAPVVEAVQRLADDLARDARADREERARAVGVKAAVPLGLCLLPAFVLLGIVPLVAGLLADLAL